MRRAYEATKAWLRGGAGAHGDRRLKRTGRRADDESAIEESLEGEPEPLKLPEGWVQGTAEEFVGLPEGYLDKVAKYRAGEYMFPPPPVCTAGWDEAAWIKFIDLEGRWL